MHLMHSPWSFCKEVLEMDRSEQFQKLNKLARDVLVLSRNTLLVNLRFLDAALSQFEFIPWPEGTFSTSGMSSYYRL